MILVGDSLGQVVLGYESTIPVTVEEMLHHLRAAHRGTQRALLVADLPYGSYHPSEEEGLRTAIRFFKEGGAEAVKIEGGKKRMGLIRRLVEAEIPVMGHIGLTPQSVRAFGGYRVQGKTTESAKAIAIINALDRSHAALMGDAPACDVCGAITVRNGNCYKCMNCGNSMGCS